jgi:hypothetical protein
LITPMLVPVLKVPTVDAAQPPAPPLGVKELAPLLV